MSAMPEEFLPQDTTPEADAVQLEMYRRMSGASSHHGRDQAATPRYREEEIRWAWQRLVLGDALFREAFPDRELVEP